MSDQHSPEQTATAEVELRLGNQLLCTKVTVPTGPTRLEALLPIVQRVADSIVDAAVDEAAEQGRTVSCKKGCGTCCRQLVPISEVEARRVRDLVYTMPEPRRSQVLRRFAEARRQLDTAGMVQTLEERSSWDENRFIDIGTRYFHQGVACPFLEEESCSIHLDRPVTCREYLVTSPAENCACPRKDNIDKIDLPVQVWTALARFDDTTPDEKYVRWVPLVLAPEWADAHPIEPTERPGPELLRTFFELLTRQKAPATAAFDSAQGKPSASEADAGNSSASKTP
jgi:Fe-S-cluster containining protein